MLSSVVCWGGVYGSSPVMRVCWFFFAQPQASSATSPTDSNKLRFITISS